MSQNKLNLSVYKASAAFVGKLGMSPPKVPECELCGKVFSCRQAKYLHKKTCGAAGNNNGLVAAVQRPDAAATTPASEDTGMVDAISSLFSSFREKPSADALSEFSMAIDTRIARAVERLAGTMDARNSVAVEVGNGASAAAVSVTQRNDHRRITINNFRIVCTDHVDHSAMVALIKANDLRASLQNVVEMLHFDPEHPENMNAYLSNALAEHGYSYHGGRWLQAPREDIAKGVMLNAGSLMNEHNDEPYSRDFTKKQTDRFDRFYDVFDVHKEPLADTIETMVKHKDAVESAHPELRSIPRRP